MSTLNEVMTQSPLLGFSTAKDALEYLNATTEQPGDSTAYTWSGIGQKLIRNFIASQMAQEDPPNPAGCSPDNWFEFNANINTIVGGPTLYNCLNSGGFDFSDSLNRAQIQSMEIVEPPWAVAVLEAMLAVGAPVQKPNWQTLGLEAQPELGDIQSWLSWQRSLRYARQISNIASGLHVLNDGNMFPDWATLKAKAIELIDSAGVELGV